MSSREIGALGREPFCRFLALLGAIPRTVAGEGEVRAAVRGLMESPATAVVLVEEEFLSLVIEELGEERPFLLCPLPGPVGDLGEADKRMNRILMQAIGSQVADA